MVCFFALCFFLGGLFGFCLWLQSRETQGLVPVTVKQISEASQSGDEKSTFVINGVDVANVLFTYCFRCLSFDRRYFGALFTRKMYEVKKEKKKKRKMFDYRFIHLLWDTGPSFESTFYFFVNQN
jgi:hypothetical protein